MLPVDFPDANITLNKPASWKDEDCLPMRAYKGLDRSGLPCIITVWLPSLEDVQAINEGRPIIMKTIGETIAPVMLYTQDEKNMPNL